MRTCSSFFGWDCKSVETHLQTATHMVFGCLERKKARHCGDCHIMSWFMIIICWAREDVFRDVNHHLEFYSSGKCDRHLLSCSVSEIVLGVSLFDLTFLNVVIQLQNLCIWLHLNVAYTHRIHVWYSYLRLVAFDVRFVGEHTIHGSYGIPKRHLIHSPPKK